MVRAIKPDYIDPFTWAQKLPREDYAKLCIYVRDRSDRPTVLDYTMSILPSVRHRQKDRLSDLFKRIDLLMSPVITRRAFVCGKESATPWQYTAYTHLMNVSGYCAVSLPAGFYKGMPVGLQIMGRPGEEALLLRAARALEREKPWAQHRPTVA
jgi:Asp-tRNA(Asn)/Glu-tRNA(Gln) amidotransferase A subunit family amidase